MSTGDMSTYIRGKLEVRKRRGNKPATFMRDGFDKWAESNTPARQGQMDKEAAPSSAPEGEMTVSEAKQMHKAANLPMGDKPIDYTYEHGQYAMQGSAKGGVNAQDFVSAITSGYNAVKSAYDSVRPELPNIKKWLENPPDEVPRGNIRTWMKSIAGWVDTLDKGLASVGLGNKRRRGGAMFTSENLTKLGQMATGIIKVLREQQPTIQKVLLNEDLNKINLGSLGPVGKRLIWLLSHVPTLGYDRGVTGMGKLSMKKLPMLEDKIGMGGKKHCKCHGSGSESESDEEVSGGAMRKDIFTHKAVGDMSSAGKIQAELNEMMKKKMSGLPFDMERYKDLKAKLEASGSGRRKVGAGIVNNVMESMEHHSRSVGKGGRSKTSSWIEHVKAYAAKHGVSYKAAMSAAKASYKK